MRWQHAFLLASLPWGHTVLAQTTLVVGPSGLPQIRDALAMATAGDTILVEPGTYAHFEVTIPVRLRAATPGTVFVHYDPAYAANGCLSDPVCTAAEGATRFAPPFATVVHVRGFRFLPTVIQAPSGSFVRHRVEVRGGRVTFDECAIETSGTVALAITDAIVHMMDTDVQSFGASSVAAGCTVLRGVATAVGGTIAGGDAIAGQVGGPGLDLESAWFYGSLVEVRGGSHFAHGYPAPAVRFSNVYQVQLADSWLFAGTSSRGDACAVVGNGNLRTARTSFITTATGCSTYADRNVVGIARSQPLQIGQPFAVGAQHDRGLPVAFYASPALGTANLPGIEQPVFVEPASAVQIGFAFTDGSYSCSIQGTVPNDPLLQGLSFWVVAVSTYGPGFPLPWLMVTPPVGGVL